jgi:hypothetical protein
MSIDKNVLEDLIEKDHTLRSMASELNCSVSAIKHWMKKYNLKTKLAYKTLKKYHTDEERLQAKRRNRVKAVTKRRKILMRKAVKYKGDQCEICGYNKCINALEFHHINPEEKEFGLSTRGLTRSWDKIKKEIDKCVLLCANCHREVHAGLINLS